MALRAARALLAVAALLAAAPAAAVICQSYTTPAQCAGRVTDAGRCGWVDGACVAVAPLETGMAAVTSVEEPRFAITSVEEPAAVAAPAPAPERALLAP